MAMQIDQQNIGEDAPKQAEEKYKILINDPERGDMIYDFEGLAEQQGDPEKCRVIVSQSGSPKGIEIDLPEPVCVAAMKDQMDRLGDPKKARDLPCLNFCENAVETLKVVYADKISAFKKGLAQSRAMKTQLESSNDGKPTASLGQSWHLKTDL